MRPMLEIADLSKSYGAVEALKSTSLDISAGEFFALLGPSGCGKTTLLRLIAGFEYSDSGTLLIDGEDLTASPPFKRPVNIVFQSYAVFPHMSVEDNVGYGLKIRGTGKSDMDRQIADALDLVQLGDYGSRMPHQLSGGQRQRVALARALIMKPKMLLLDEPLSALDRKLRKDMQLELMRLQKEVGITFIIVTHDQEEALSMASRIAVMKDGMIQQIADPETLYEQPANTFVADFLGNANLVPVQCDGIQDGIAEIRMGPHQFNMQMTGNSSSTRMESPHLMIRPEQLQLSAQAPEAQTNYLSLPVTYKDQLYLGEQRRIYVETPDQTRWEVSISPHEVPDLEPGNLTLTIPLNKALLLPETTSSV